jgi:hypothetical protein
MRYFSRVAATLLLAIGGCSSDATAPAVDLPNGSMSARIDGAQWNATALVHATRHQNILSIGGGGLLGGQAVAIAITANPVTGTGTITFGPGVNANAVVGANQTASWMASTTQGSGSFTITALDATRVTGTFAFNADAVGSSTATGTRTVTQGQFDILF